MLHSLWSIEFEQKYRMNAMCRNVNIDVLRVIIMFFILLEHMLVFSVFHDNYTSSQIMDASSYVSLINFLGFEFIETLCSVAVNCFIFITGYFYINNLKTKELKIINTWVYVFFYSFGLSILCFLVGSFLDFPALSFKDLVKSIFVVRSPYYWFVPQYLGLLLVSPYLSRVVDGFSKKQYQVLLLCLGPLSLSFWGFPFGNIFGAKDGAGFIWFIFLFYTAGYIRLYIDNISIKKVFVTFFILFVLEFLNLTLNGVNNYILNNKIVYSFYSITTGTNGIVYLMSVAFFILILNMKMRDTIWHSLAKLSPYVFSVYLITSHKGVKFFLYERYNFISQIFDNIYFLPILLAFSLLLFILCVLVDKGREYLFRLIKVEKLLQSISNTLNKFIV